jgi:hypothetical protein
MAMAATVKSLADLPNELIQHIAQFAKENGTIVNLSATCRHIYENCYPIIYSRIKQTDSKILPKIIRSTGAKPHLAKLVKRFSGEHNVNQDYSLVSGVTEDDFLWIDSKFIGRTWNPEAQACYRARIYRNSAKITWVAEYDILLYLIVCLLSELEFFECVYRLGNYRLLDTVDFPQDLEIRDVATA